MHIEYTPEQLAIQPKLADANINPESFLATDYLNHFNEIAMLLEMIPDMPELIEDAAEWAPKTYIKHFQDSGFQACDLAVNAYNLAPSTILTAFETICGQLDSLIVSTLAGLANLNAAERGLSPAAQDLIKTRVLAVQELLMQLNKVIHGKIDDQITVIANKKPHAEEPEEVQTQEDIDKLFG